MATKSGTARTLVILAAAALVLGALAPASADDWDDPRRQRVEDEVSRVEREEAARRGDPVALRSIGSLVGLRHGKVQMVADLARVDLTLEIQNTGTNPLEWSRSFALDPLAEAIGASLQRGTDEPVPAQTLSLEDARRIYGEIRNPRPRRRTGPLPFSPQTAGRGGGGDPLRIERPTRDQLDVVVWPIAPNETVRVALTFVTPLRGRGDSRTYVDPIQGDRGVARPGAVVTAPDRDQPRILTTMDTSWMIRTGGLEVEGEAVGMVPVGEAGGWRHYKGARGREASAGPRLPLRVPNATDTVWAVPGGGFGTRVAVFHFDPVAFLEKHDLQPPRDARLRLVKRTGSTSRIAPWEFGVTDDPLPVTARLLPKSEKLRYAVEVVARDGKVLDTVEVRRAVHRTDAAKDERGTITGWHRAVLAQRVRDWAASQGGVRQREALEFAVDLGVLTAGTAALAVPEEERRQLRRRSRRDYFQEGAPLGAQDREADVKAPPARSTSR